MLVDWSWYRQSLCTYRLAWCRSSTHALMISRHWSRCNIHWLSGKDLSPLDTLLTVYDRTVVLLVHSRSLSCGLAYRSLALCRCSESNTTFFFKILYALGLWLVCLLCIFSYLKLNFNLYVGIFLQTWQIRPIFHLMHFVCCRYSLHSFIGFLPCSLPDLPHFPHSLSDSFTPVQWLVS